MADITTASFLHSIPGDNVHDDLYNDHVLCHNIVCGTIHIFLNDFKYFDIMQRLDPGSNP
jgi:hypothetical protein